MHPYPSTGKFVATLSGLNEKADKENFLVAHPDGLGLSCNALICCSAEDDVGFIRAMTKRLVDKWTAGPDRIYATGISNGADMSFKVTVELHDTFTAVAPVSGAYSGQDTEDTRTSAKCGDKSEVVTYDLMVEFFVSHPKQRS